jgi:hypothetical protein
MPLFIDRLPFHTWVDATRTPHRITWTAVLPVILAEPTLLTAPPIAGVQEWALDTGNRGEAFAWRHHLVQAGLDPDVRRLPQRLTIRTATGQALVPVRDADLWLVSNVPSLAQTPFRIVLRAGLPFSDTTAVPDPEYQRPLIGLRAMRTAGLRVEIDCAADTVSVWTP